MDGVLSSVFQFKVTLHGSSPPIWRRIVVSSEFTFFELHAAIQDAMGWKHQHNYEFFQFSSVARHTDWTTSQLLITRPQLNQPLSVIDSRIGSYLWSVGHSACYLYDAQSRWIHHITLEAIHQRLPSVSYPLCLGGEKACPPEGLGGIQYLDGYFKALADAAHPEHEYCHRYRASVGGPLAREQFDHRCVVFVSAEAVFRLGCPPPYQQCEKTHEYGRT